MIDEKVLIERLEETRWTTIFDTSCIFENDKLDKCIKIVNQLAEEMGVSKMENTTWIPCSERLPDDWQNVYITGKIVDKVGRQSYREVFGEPEPRDCYYGYHHNGRFYGITEEGIYWLIDAVAWQPLPPKYEPKEDKQK